MHLLLLSDLAALFAISYGLTLGRSNLCPLHYALDYTITSQANSSQSTAASLQLQDMWYQGQENQAHVLLINTIINQQI